MRCCADTRPTIRLDRGALRRVRACALCENEYAFDFGKIGCRLMTNQQQRPCWSRWFKAVRDTAGVCPHPDGDKWKVTHGNENLV